ncbi:methyl-accepting chemotaxis protein [Desulfoplanes sp.]
MLVFKNMLLWKKIGGGFAIVLLLTMTVSFIGWQSMHVIVERSGNADDMNVIVEDVLGARIQALYFLNKKSSSYAQKVHENLAHLQIQAEQSRDTFNDPAEKALMDRVFQRVGEYDRLFGLFADLEDQKKTLLEGMRTRADRVLAGAAAMHAEQTRQFNESIDTSVLDTEEIGLRFQNTINAGRIQYHLLEAHRNILEFVRSGSTEARDRANVDFAAAMELAQEVALQSSSRANIEKGKKFITDLEGYKTDFLNYVDLMDKQKVQMQHMVTAAAATDDACDAARKDQKQKMESQIASAGTFLMGGTSLALILGILIAFVITRAIVQVMQKGVVAAEGMSGGDMTVNVDIDQKDEIGLLAGALNAMVHKLKKIVADVQSASANVASGSQELSASSEQLSQGTTEQAASIEEVSSSIEEMAANIRQNTENAVQTEKIAVKVAEDAQETGTAVGETVDAMKNIADKISIIEEIARNTNLLALNAAIEAARAGDHGKGFAVVAAEVRKLAENSGNAAAEISELSGSSVAKAEHAGKMLDDIVPDIRKTADLVQEIAAASKEQDAGAEQINQAVQQLDQVVQRNASASEEMAATSEELSSQAEQLQSTMAFFTIEQGNNRANIPMVPKNVNVVPDSGQGRLPESGAVESKHKPGATGVDLQLENCMTENQFERF